MRNAKKEGLMCKVSFTLIGWILEKYNIGQRLGMLYLWIVCIVSLKILRKLNESKEIGSDITVYFKQLKGVFIYIMKNWDKIHQRPTTEQVPYSVSNGLRPEPSEAPEYHFQD